MGLELIFFSLLPTPDLKFLARSSQANVTRDLDLLKGVEVVCKMGVGDVISNSGSSLVFLMSYHVRIATR